MGTVQTAVSTYCDQDSQEVTLLELVQAICDVTDDDREVVATVCHMLRNGSVRLCGNFRGQTF